MMKTYVLLTLIFSALGAQAFEAGDYVQARGSKSVNLRSRPNGPIVGQVTSTTSVQVKSERSIGGWTPVTYNGKTAYVFNSLVTPTSDPHPDTSNQVMIDAPNGANLRTSPSLSSPIADTIDDDMAVKVTGHAQGDWVPVTVGRKSGYIKRDLLTGYDDLEANAPCSGNCPKRSNAPVASDDSNDILSKAQRAATGDSLNKWSLQGWKSAVKGRYKAGFLGGGWRSGNRSKGMCASAVKEAMVNAGICNKRPDGNAYSMHTSGSLARSCPKLKLSSIRDPRKAPAGSIIIYSGYAGKIPHKFGHTESKILVTRAVLAKVNAERRQTGDPKLKGVKLGQYLYCSDFCRAAPTMTRHNPVAAIYTLR